MNIVIIALGPKTLLIILFISVTFKLRTEKLLHQEIADLFAILQEMGHWK